MVEPLFSVKLKSKPTRFSLKPILNKRLKFFTETFPKNKGKLPSKHLNKESWNVLLLLTLQPEVLIFLRSILLFNLNLQNKLMLIFTEQVEQEEQAKVEFVSLFIQDSNNHWLKESKDSLKLKWEKLVLLNQLISLNQVPEILLSVWKKSVKEFCNISIKFPNKWSNNKALLEPFQKPWLSFQVTQRRSLKDQFCAQLKVTLLILLNVHANINLQDLFSVFWKRTLLNNWLKVSKVWEDWTKIQLFSMSQKIIRKKCKSSSKKLRKELLA